jgi:pimeloyl-ACP methyl ester carboxylesterase
MDTLNQLTRGETADCTARLSRLWEKNLGVPVSSEDDYFQKGGGSLRAAQLLVWIQEDFGVDLTLLDIFEVRTLACQADLIRTKMGASAAGPEKAATSFRFFGPAGARLFGALHRPANNPAKHGIVLCYPFGQEYMRIHRTYVELARSLAAAGLYVLRFDYFGCGDSAGDGDAGEFHIWKADIQRAIDHLRAETGLREIYLLGARIGANLALDVARHTAGLAGIVLWEPIVKGPDYVTSLRKAHRELLASNAELDGYDQRPLPDNCHAEFAGYPVSQKLHFDLTAVDLASGPGFHGLPPGLVLANSHKPVLEEYVATRASEQPDLTYSASGESDAIWLKEDRQNKGVIPVQAIQTIVSWVSRRAA